MSIDFSAFYYSVVSVVNVDDITVM